MRFLNHLFLRCSLLALAALMSVSAFAFEVAVDLQLTSHTLKQFRYAPRTPPSSIHTVTVGDSTRLYRTYIPKNLDKNGVTVVIALHGAGRTGHSMIDTWAGNADKHGFVVLAPDGINKNWNVRGARLALLERIIEGAVKRYGWQVKRTFLFGHSNGAKMALKFFADSPNRFQAVAVHAGTLPGVRPKNKATGARVALFLGDNDHIFSLNSARQTTAWLDDMGATWRLYVLKKHNHWYYNDAHRINESIWQFMSQ